MKAESMTKILISDKHSPVVVQRESYNRHKVGIHYAGNPYEGVAVDVYQLVRALQQLYGKDVLKCD